MRTFLLIILSIFSLNLFAQVNLAIKIDKTIDNKKIEINKIVKTDFDKPVIISDSGLSDKLILTIKKIKNVFVNGSKIEPIQIQLKTNSKEKKDSIDQTVTSFYSNSAHFNIAANEHSEAMSVELQFNEIN